MSSTAKLPRGIETINNSPEISRYFGENNLPYTSKQQALTEILERVRYIGQTVNINKKEWWFSEGVSDSDLVIKKVAPSFQETLEVDRTATISPLVPKPTELKGAANKEYVDEEVSKADKHFTWEQSTPSDHWICIHNLDKKVSVTITDSANTVVEGQVLINDGTTVEIKFNTSFWGQAHFN